MQMRPVIKHTKDHFNHSLIGAEIGVFEGQHAISILNNLRIKRLYLIDPFINYTDYPETFNFDIIKKNAYKNLEPYKDRIIWVNNKFDYNQIPEQLDFIYIDGNHSYTYIKHNIEVGNSLVKPGGIIGGHDYYHIGNFAGVGKAVDEYCNKNKCLLNVSGLDWWYIKEQSIKWYKYNYITRRPWE